MGFRQYHYMVDIETFGIKADAIPVTIAACRFALDEISQVEETYYAKVDVESAQQKGLSFSASTVLWWLEQDEKARDEILDKANRLPLAESLMGLASFIGRYESPIVWAKGPEFDIKILDTAYEKCGLKPSWNYYNVQSVRTMEHLNKILNLRVPIRSAKHSAYEDVIIQAENVIKIYQALKRATPRG